VLERGCDRLGERLLLNRVRRHVSERAPAGPQHGLRGKGIRRRQHGVEGGEGGLTPGTCTATSGGRKTGPAVTAHAARDAHLTALAALERSVLVADEVDALPKPREHLEAHTAASKLL
jgi:hypothetical protein